MVYPIGSMRNRQNFDHDASIQTGSAWIHHNIFSTFFIFHCISTKHEAKSLPLPLSMFWIDRTHFLSELKEFIFCQKSPKTTMFQIAIFSIQNASSTNNLQNGSENKHFGTCFIKIWLKMTKLLTNIKVDPCRSTLNRRHMVKIASSKIPSIPHGSDWIHHVRFSKTRSFSIRFQWNKHLDACFHLHLSYYLCLNDSHW